MSGRIPPEIIDRIRESVDIVELISGYVQLQRKGGNYFGLCPFHPEKTPSFSVHPGKSIFHCFGCGAGGNAFTFLQLHDKLSFAEAARELARRCGIIIPERPAASPEQTERYDALYRANEFAAAFYTRCLWEGKGEEFDAVREYLKRRQISSDLAKAFRLGYAPERWDSLIKETQRQKSAGVTLRDLTEAGLILRKEASGSGASPIRDEGSAYDRFRGRLMFPILNLSGKVVAFGGRVLKAESEGAKYINSPQTPIYNKGSLLYGLYQAREPIRRREECLIVEGYTDLMRCHEGGFAHAVATSGTALTSGQAQVLRRLCRKVILVYDGDAAGSHASVRGGDVLLTGGLDVRVVGLPQGHDPDSFIRSQGAAAFGSLIEEAKDTITYRIELYRREGRLTDALSCSEVAHELLESLAIIPDSIRRELMATDAARQIGLAPETLLRELAKKKRPPAANGRTEERTTEDPLARLPIKQRSLVEALLRWPELRAAAFAEVTAAEFQDGILRRVATKLEDGWVSGRELSGEELIGEDTLMEDVTFISGALSQMEAEAEPGADRHAMRRYVDYRCAQDCLRDLLQERLSRSYQKLQRELAAAPGEDVKRITREMKEILERQKLMRGRLFWTVPPHPSMDFPEKELTLPGIGPADSGE